VKIALQSKHLLIPRQLRTREDPAFAKIRAISIKTLTKHSDLELISDLTIRASIEVRALKKHYN